jgi:tRNA modification GTPase
MFGKRAPIIALATASGKAGVGVIRLSGEDLRGFIEKLFHIELIPRQATLLTLKSASSEPIDTGLALFFPSPNSFTGEDVLEFQGHGGILVMDLIIQRCLEVGKPYHLRLANPGEFSERAFLNNKIDLAQAEAIADLIDANSQAAVKSASRSLTGVFSIEVNELIDRLTQLRVLVEATLDFPEEEIDFLEKAQAKNQWLFICQSLNKLLKASEQGAILRTGALVVLAGAPNVGKSSILNQLAGQDLAIVTPVAGTTRDRLRETIQIDGVPVQLIDTAGIRDGIDEVERLGIERSWQTIREADVILFIRDISHLNETEHDELYIEIQRGISHEVPPPIMIEVWNKQDATKHMPHQDRLVISAKTGYGFEELRARILQAIGWESQSENVIFARQRHIDALLRALEHVQNAGNYLLLGNQSLELFAEELRLAQVSLGEITGKVLADELLGKIFSSFCIGK